jgi:glycosyltransferase involved in cell wall biosynthesis
VRVYWYWPYLRPEQLPLVDATAEVVGEVVAHTVASRISGTDADRARATIERSLPDVGDERERSLRWLWSRGAAYPNRARSRYRRVRSGFDVAHVVFLNPFTDWWSLARLGRAVPLVTSVHDAVPHESRLPRALEYHMLRRVYATAGEIVVHHSSVAQQLRDQFGVDPDRIHEVPLWVLPAPAEPRSAPKPRPTVLCFGALRRNKGVEVLLAAIAELDGFDADFHFAGRGAPDVEARLRAAAAADARIQVEIGYVSEDRKHELHRAADLIVLPYTSFASQSAVLHDAYAHGRPVVVTDVGALGETVRADGTGTVVPPSDPGALAAAIRRLASSPDEWRRAAEAATAVGQHRSPEVVAQGFATAYHRAIERFRPGAGVG